MDNRKSKDCVAFELVEQNGAKIYDSVESNGFLFSEEVEYEDEYAIISGCDDADSNVNEISLLYAEYGGNCDKESDKKYGACKEDITNAVHNKNQVREEVSSRNQASKGTVFLSPHKSNICIEISPRRFNSKTTLEDDDNDMVDNVFPYGSTSTPNKEYEMKIIAGPNDVSELVQSPDRNELEEKAVRRKGSAKRLKELSTRVRRSLDEVVQHNGDECLDNIPLEDLRQLNSEIIYQHDHSNKKYTIPDKYLSLELKNGGILPGTEMRSIDTKSVDQNATDKTYAGKCVKRTTHVDVNSQAQKFSSRTKVDNNMESNEMCGIEEQLLMEEIKDDSFFEIDNYRYREFVNNCEYEPVELEMKTILNHVSSDNSDNSDGLPTVTEFVHPAKIENLRGGEISCRYISIFRQEKCKCKYITIAFVNVNLPRDKLKLDVPCEEVIEEIYSHFITEVIIYEDDIDNSGVLSSIYKDWVLL